METTAITDTIQTLFKATDDIDWELVKSTFDDQIVLDYSSMGGGRPSTLTPDQVVRAWSFFLPGFDKTNHQLSDMKVEINGVDALATYRGYAEHFIGNEIWVVEGNYETRLVKKQNRWLIISQKMNFIRQSGNRKLPDVAAARLSRK